MRELVSGVEVEQQCAVLVVVRSRSYREDGNFLVAVESRSRIMVINFYERISLRFCL